MGFFEKLKRAIKKIKGKLIVSLILILVIIVWGFAPFSTALKDGLREATGRESVNWEVLLMNLGLGLTKPLEQFKKCIIEDEYRGTFWLVTRSFLGFYALFVLIGIIKAIPKSEYEDIENGSSDWSEGGEQYKVLSKNKGIVLAEKNYLPVDKRGNVNVLIVRRFWCW